MAKIPVFALLCPAIEGCATGGIRDYFFHQGFHIPSKLATRASTGSGIQCPVSEVRGLMPFAMQDRRLQRKGGLP